MNSYSVLLKKEILELIRSYKFLAAMAVFAFFGIMSPLAAKYMPEIIKLSLQGQNIKIEIPPVNIMEAYNQFIKNISQIGLFLCIPLAMGAVTREKETGNLTFLLTKPVPRTLYLAAKFSAYALLIAVALGASALLAGLYTYILFGELGAGGFAGITLMLYLYCLTFTFVTIFFSTVIPSGAATAGLSFLVWILLTLAGNLGAIGRYSPASLLREAPALLSGMKPLPDPYIGALVVIALAVAGSLFLFRKWEPK